MNSRMSDAEISGSCLTYEFTTDMRYMLQYAELVKQYYKKDLNLDLAASNMDQDLCCLNRNERLFIVRDGITVVGGAKLSFSSTLSDVLLPMESSEFRVQSVLPKKYGKYTYAELGRLVVNPDFRGKEVLARIIQELTAYTVQQGGGYLFVLAPPLNSVLYRRVCKGLSMKVAIHKDVDWGEKDAYKHLQLQLLSCDIRELYPQSVPAEAEFMPIAI
ncbi:MAG: GNAT family N-acetyltransferase [Gammaproteobacteria bacterium]|nr:GNAT family N-acetyltransferase [Gammaproteobacteria bacterium]